MSLVLISLIAAAFIVGATWITGRAATAWKKVSADHVYRMTQLRFTEDKDIHRRYLEATESDRPPSNAVLNVRAAEAAANAVKAEAQRIEAETILVRAKNRSYR